MFKVEYESNHFPGDPHPAAGLSARHRCGCRLLHSPHLRHPPRQGSSGHLMKHSQHQKTGLLLKRIFDGFYSNCYI